jgi:hypothetical protein
MSDLLPLVLSYIQARENLEHAKDGLFLARTDAQEQIAEPALTAAERIEDSAYEQLRAMALTSSALQKMRETA